MDARRGCREATATGHSLWLRLGVCDLADEDGVLRVADVSLLMHVGGGDGEHGAVVVEGQRGDAGRVAVELTQPLLVEGVPDVDEAVRAAWQGQRVNGQPGWGGGCPSYRHVVGATSTFQRM